MRRVVILAGMVRATGLAAQVGRSVLDLPVDAEQTLLDVWLARLQELVLPDRRPAEASSVAVHVLLDANSSLPKPKPIDPGSPLRVGVRRDHRAYRGTAGLLRDTLSPSSAADGPVLVATGSQCPDQGQIAQLLRLHAQRPETGATLSVSAVDGRPSGLIVLRHDALAGVPDLGYADLKQQVLPTIADGPGVRVVEHQRPVAVPLRTPEAYLDALRSWSERGSLAGVRAIDPFCEQWRPAFTVVEPGARVAPTARLHDAVVLAGGEVRAGATVVRCVVGPGGVVRRGEIVRERLIRGGRSSRHGGAA